MTKISFKPEDAVTGLPYTIFMNDVPIATICGPMAAIVCEAACKMLETKHNIHVTDILKRKLVY